jgi:hypothetical protein
MAKNTQSLKASTQSFINRLPDFLTMVVEKHRKS